MTASTPPSILAARWTELALAFALLTRLPAPPIRATRPVAVGAYIWAFPIAGLVVAALSAGALWAVRSLGGSPSLAALAALAVSALATGALHEDGLADFCDGIGGGRTRARKLAIMRDSSIGTYGAVALFLSLGLRWSALAAMAPADAMAALTAAHVLSRALLVLPLEYAQAARRDGLAAQSGGSWQASAACLLIGGGLVWLFCPPDSLVLGPLAAGAGVAGVTVTAVRQLGGYTGDVLGAAEQLAEVLVLTTASIWFSH